MAIVLDKARMYESVLILWQQTEFDRWQKLGNGRFRDAQTAADVWCDWFISTAVLLSLDYQNVKDNYPYVAGAWYTFLWQTHTEDNKHSWGVYSSWEQCSAMDQQLTLESVTTLIDHSCSSILLNNQANKKTSLRQSLTRTRYQ